MRLIRVAAGILNQTPLDWDGNLANILHAIDQARQQQVALLCLPELCLSGYGCEDAFLSAGLVRQCEELLLELAPQTVGIAVSVGLPVQLEGAVFNAAALLVDGQLVGLVAKQHLAGDGIHYEPRWFKPWPNDIRRTIEIGGNHYPIGDLVFDVGGILIGFEICEDAWVGERPGATLASRGVDVLFNPSASHFAFGKNEVRKRFVLEGSRAFQVSYVYANLVGNEAGRAIYDGDAMIATLGKMVRSAPRFTYELSSVVTAVIDIDGTRSARSRIGSYQPDWQGAADSRVEVDFRPVSVNVESYAEEPAEATDHETKCEEFTRAVSLGLFDYMRKSRSQGVVISMSGGADSAAVATLCRLMIDYSVGSLGIDGVRQRLSYCRDSIRTATSTDELAAQLITTVYQATSNSTETTRSAAAQVAAALASRHVEFDVDSLVQRYTELVEGAVGRRLTWELDDIALQNIQARTRAPSVWMLANLFGALLLSTSNRSEAAVGYATMDGDTSGGLAPIAGIDKAFLRRWLQWMETRGPADHAPIAALAHINRQQPTAELRPAAAEQTDESDLMPYDVLDAIERWAILDKLTPAEVYQHLALRYPQHGAKLLVEWISRFFQLWCRNQWKRERYAPSFHVDDENLDPKTWCRFPILSGGFERELAELRRATESVQP